MALFTDPELASLKTRYDENYETNVFSNTPTAGAIANKKKMGGSTVRVAIKNGATAGVGARLGALTDANLTTQRQAFTVEPGTLYAQAIVDNVAALFSESKEDAIVSTFGDEQDSCFAIMSQLMENCLMNDGSGCQATILSNTGAGPYVLTLTQQTNAYRFAINQVIASKATPFAASLDAGTATISAIDQITGKITVTAAGGWTPTNTHVFGLANTVAAATTVQQPVGLPGWLTNDATALAASFYGVVHSSDQVHFAGNVVDCTTLNIRQAVETTVTAICNIGGARPDFVELSPSNYLKLLALTNDQRRYVDVKGQDVDVSYSGFQFMGPRGTLTVLQSPACPSDNVFVLDSRTWFLSSPNGDDPVMPAFRGDMGWINLQATDQCLIRLRAAFCFYTDCPAYNGKAIVTP